MKFYDELKKHLINCKSSLCLLGFFTLISYGYFITNWGLGVDSEMTSFLNTNLDNIYVYKFGRFGWYVLDLILNNHVIPFWNDFFSIFLIFLSSIIWSMQLSKLNHDKQAIFIFSLIYIISPLYVFYLRFTIYNIPISLGMLLTSVASYYFSCVLQKIERKQTYYTEFLLAFIYAYFSLSIYQMFAAFWISSVLLIVTHRVLLTRIIPQLPYAKIMAQWILMGFFLLVLSTGLYELTCLSINHFSGNDPYINSYISWGNRENHDIFIQLMGYFKSLFLIYSFNFFWVVTLFFLFLLLIIMIYQNVKNSLFAIALGALFISSFFLPLALGTPMPIRTLQNIPLVLAGTWMIFYLFFDKQWVKQFCMIFICVATFFNAHFIVRLFYSDNIRLQQDIVFANHLHQFLLNRVGDHIYSKPLVIVGKHHASSYPFTLRSEYDVLGLSFFELYEQGINEISKYHFMSWLGNEYIKPTESQADTGRLLSESLSAFPAHNSVKETDELIILKLSKNQIQPNQHPIHLNSNAYQHLVPHQGQSAIDILNKTNNTIYIEGWSFLNNKNASNTNVYIKFKSDKTTLVFPTNEKSRRDIAKAFQGAGINLEQAGFSLSLNTSYFTPGVYLISLISINDPFLYTINTGKAMKI